MTIEVAGGFNADRGRPALGPHWPLAAGLLLLAVPTIVRLSQQVWFTEAGAHGPIVLVIGIWLLFHNRFLDQVGQVPTRWGIVAAALVPALAIYVFGRAYDFISLEVLGLYGAFLAVAYRLVGGAAMRASVFPFLYLAFLVPPPGWLIDRVTGPLQHFISFAATGLLQAFDYPVAREGVTIIVAQYRLLVEDACAGMNSLVGLTAISILYIYLMHRASLRYAGLLMLLIVPIAITTNLLRVLVLCLITFYFGEEAAQGFLHSTTGLVTFCVAVGLMILIDSMFRRGIAWWSGQA